MMALIGDYVQSDFYETFAEFDYKGRLVGRLRNVQQPPAELSVLVGDCVHNLRSALDHLAYVLASGHSGPLSPARARTSAFPLFKTGPEFRDRAAGMMAGMSRRARASIERLQPYHRRRCPPLWRLWMLHELSNIDKHRLVHVTAAVVAETRLEVSGTGVLRIERIEAAACPIEERAGVGRFYGDFELPPAVQVRANIIPDIVFGKGGDARAVRGESVLATLNEIRDVIALIVLPELHAELARLFPGAAGLAVHAAEMGLRRPPDDAFA